MERLAELRAAGCGPDLELARWLEALPDRVKERLVAWGLLEPARVAATRPLSQHLADWTAALLAKGNTEAHAALVAARAGVHPRVAQSPARHCTITLTMDRYTHVLHEREVDALGPLPDLCIPPTVVESGRIGRAFVEQKVGCPSG